ncbi:MAG TPA: tetratricopeptide repeat protein [Actinomycetota bacterium]|nr:tetratricopeptide repeat protein [Actinomycetota bacterium]
MRRDRFGGETAGGGSRRIERPLPRAVVDDIRATSRPGRADAAIKAFEDVVSLLEEGRVSAAVSAAEAAKDHAPRSGAVRELLGIALYQSERFREALRELQAYRRMTGRVDQNHLIADCHRALGAPEKAIEPAREALRATIDDEARAEAAVVGASALADLGRFDEALAMTRALRTDERTARPFDLRLWYTAGDVLERAGRRPEAALEFARVVDHDPSAFDAAERLATLQAS